jgi:hypothetical protein
MRSVMRWIVVGDLMVCVTSSGEPDRATVARFLEDLRSKPIRRIVTTPMSIADNLAAERQACGEICASKQIQVALVVDPGLVSAYEEVAASSYSTVAAFAWDDADSALRHLAVGGAALAQAHEALASLRAGAESMAA